MEIEPKAIIFHGAGETPASIWIPYTSQGLAAKGYRVLTPEFPAADRPELGLWLPTALTLSYTAETVLIAHSAGSALALSVLERLQGTTVRRTISVAGFCTPNEVDEFWFEGENPILQKNYDWAKIRASVGQLICLNSDNDPYGCNEGKGQEIVEAIGPDKARLIVMKGQGHMGSDFFEQPYREFPFLLSLIPHMGMQSIQKEVLS